MEDILQRAGSQAVTFAIRSGLSIASGYAIKTLTRFMDKIPESERSTLQSTKTRLQTKITIITPAIDLIELISARGNTSLTSTLDLTQELKADIDEFEKKINDINEKVASKGSKESQKEIKHVEEYIKDLLFRIEESIPLISLALTTSGANLSARLPDSVSPGRLLQASNYLSNADSTFVNKKGLDKVQIGPEFVLKLYSIFYGTNRNPHSAVSGDITWKEEHAKCTVKLWRVPDEDYFYSYQMSIDENFDDERYHDDEEEPRHRDLDLTLITRLFFSASGRLLEIEEAKTPVLVLKLNPLDDSDDGRIEWLAFEEYPDSDDDNDEDSDSTESENETEAEAGDDDNELTNRFNELSLNSIENSNNNPASLSLLEYIIRLAALQANDQQSMYTITDERISLYLRDESTDNNHNQPNMGSNPGTPLGQFGSSPSHRRASPRAMSTSTSIAVEPKASSSSTSSPRTPSKPGVASDKSPVLTPWEKDRLKSKQKNLLRRHIYEGTPSRLN